MSANVLIWNWPHLWSWDETWRFRTGRGSSSTATVNRSPLMNIAIEWFDNTMKVKSMLTNLTFPFGVFFGVESELKDTDVGVGPLGLNGQRYLIGAQFAFAYQCKWSQWRRLGDNPTEDNQTYTFVRDRLHIWRTSKASHSSCNSWATVESLLLQSFDQTKEGFCRATKNIQNVSDFESQTEVWVKRLGVRHTPDIRQLS